MSVVVCFVVNTVVVTRTNVAKFCLHEENLFFFLTFFLMALFLFVSRGITGDYLQGAGGMTMGIAGE
jgi:hypothetical protein